MAHRMGYMACSHRRVARSCLFRRTLGLGLLGPMRPVGAYRGLWGFGGLLQRGLLSTP